MAMHNDHRQKFSKEECFSTFCFPDVIWKWQNDLVSLWTLQTWALAHLFHSFSVSPSALLFSIGLHIHCPWLSYAGHYCYTLGFIPSHKISWQGVERERDPKLPIWRNSHSGTSTASLLDTPSLPKKPKGVLLQQDNQCTLAISL